MTREDFIELVREAGVTLINGDDCVYQKRNGRPYIFGLYDFKAVRFLHLEVNVDDYTSVLWHIDSESQNSERLAEFHGISPIRFLVGLDREAVLSFCGKLADAQFASTMTRSNLEGLKDVHNHLVNLL